MFVALEILSLPLYLLCGLARRRRLLSQEAALKYFLLGALSSAFFLYGTALLYGYSGSFALSAIDDAIRNGPAPRAPGLLLGRHGPARRRAAVQVRRGAVPLLDPRRLRRARPTPVTGFMAACTKIAAIGALMRVFYVGLGADRWDWQPLMAIVAMATMAVGSVLAITQTDVKRMLAYSSIAHAGFIMTAFVGASQAVDRRPPGCADQRLVGDVLPGRVRGGDHRRVRAGHHGPRLQRRGDPAVQLGRPRAALAAGRRCIFSLFMLSFAGIPLTSGFIGKWAVFAAAWTRRCALARRGRRGDQRGRRVLLHPGHRADVLHRPESDGPAEVVRPGWTTLLAVGVGVVATVAFGIFPGPLLDLAQHAGEFIR